MGRDRQFQDSGVRAGVKIMISKSTTQKWFFKL